MASLPGWGGENPLPAEYEGHLQLPDTVTERTRQLAEELTGHLDSPYAKATAIESYLRTYEYDLSVPEPPPGVTDVTDFFLFELKRGYCDYYATAFVTLARLAGLPTRFATGYAVGAWDGFDRVWVVSEAEAHSWPEVLFPEVGWIPFEPTAGRPSLTRIGLPQASSSGPANAGQPTVDEIEAPGIDLELADAGLAAAARAADLGNCQDRRRLASRPAGSVGIAVALGKSSRATHRRGRNCARIWRWAGGLRHRPPAERTGHGTSCGPRGAGPKRRRDGHPVRPGRRTASPPSTAPTTAGNG